VDNICPPFQERRSLPFHIGNDSPLMLRWRQSFHVATRVFLVGFFFIVVLKNISFKNYSFHHTVHFRHDFKLISNT
jgi:hypothetical protein